LSGSLPQAARLAGRSLARHRVRSSAVIGAVAAVAAVVVAGSTLYASDKAYDCCESTLPSLREDQVLVSASVPPPGPVVPPAPEATMAPVELVEEEEPALAGAPGVPDDVLAEIEAIVDPKQLIPLARLELAEGELFTTWISEEEGTGPGGELAAEIGPSVGVATPALLDAFELPTELRERLDAGEAVAVHEPPTDDARVAISVYDAELGSQPQMVELEIAEWFESPAAAESLPTVLVGGPLIEELGATIEPAEQVLLVLDEALTSEQRDQVELLFEDLRWTGGETMASLFVTLPSNDGVSEELVRTAILAASFVVMLGVVAIGLALAAKDDEDERTVLVAVGAAPRSLRRVDALRAALLVVVAVGLALPGGLIPALAIVAAGSNTDPTYAVDPVTLAYLVLVPAATGLCVWLVRWARDLVRPVRPDTFSFGD
jgi:putative ABC transport system permease protein